LPRSRLSARNRIAPPERLAGDANSGTSRSQQTGSALRPCRRERHADHRAGAPHDPHRRHGGLLRAG